MTQFSIEIHKDLLQAIKLPAEEVPNRLQTELAIRLYEKGLLGFRKARELAGMSRWEFHDLLGDEGVTRRYDVEELGEDLKTIEEIG